MIKNIIPLAICVNFHDFLSHSLAANRSLFERYYVVTKKEDIDTIEVCNKYDVNVHLYDDGNHRKSIFNKSAMIWQLQIELHKQYPDAWILLIDSDICLPKNFEEIWEKACETGLDQSALYGMLRDDYWEYEDYKESKNPRPYGGPRFVGFFQLYFDKSKYYPKDSNDASLCDMHFLNSFKKKYHLTESEKVMHLGKAFVNHRGRNYEKWPLMLPTVEE